MIGKYNFRLYVLKEILLYVFKENIITLFLRSTILKQENIRNIIFNVTFTQLLNIWHYYLTASDLKFSLKDNLFS